MDYIFLQRECIKSVSPFYGVFSLKLAITTPRLLLFKKIFAILPRHRFLKKKASY